MTTEDDAPPRSDAQQVCWLAIFGANLIVPLAFGLPMTEQQGRAGLLAGLAVLFAGWQFVIPRFGPLRAVLVPGGVALAASQVFPAVQVVAGAMSFAIVGLDDAFRPSRFDEASAFAVTLTTGGLLWLAAMLAGFVLRGVGRRLRRAGSKDRSR